MTVAIPLFGNRVAPTFIHADRIVLARTVARQSVRLGELNASGMTESERITLLDESKVTALVCGGIDCDLMQEIQDRGIQVINNVAGDVDDVLAQFAAGALSPGYGILRQNADSSPAICSNNSSSQTQSISEDSVIGTPDCAECLSQACMKGQPCPAKSRTEKTSHPAESLQEIMDVALDVASEPERVLCRIAETVYFCLGMKYKRVGVAFCTELMAEAQTVTRLLRRFFEVVPICCRFGGPDEVLEDLVGAAANPKCDPCAMAQVLNEAKTDINILMGLCIGTDLVFSQLSLAPVTTLFVKDRLLANNPIAAAHSKQVLEQALGRV